MMLKITDHITKAIEQLSLIMMALFSVWLQENRLNRRQRSSTAGHCVRHRRVDRALGMMARKERRDRSCTWRSIPWGIFWLCTSPRQTGTTGRKPVHLRKPLSRQQMVALNWYGPIRAIPDQNRQKPPESRISPSKSSGCRRQNGVLFCCPVAGSWRDRSRGQHGAEGS